ncbi:MAG: hypothetical protein HYV90_04625 [Candidatus Woesebacteria bacterium]|nr:MAG: hypothetical protein HYV90_04625 [Candidatus Woesebacteria bacterium]
MPKILLSLSLFVLLLVVFSSPVSANHTWNGYHWARTSNPFALKLGDNVTSGWDTYLATASSDWTTSDVLDTAIVAGQGGRTCKATNGRVEVCNKKYGNNGWLGIAQIWITGGVHITQGVTKMNDTYFGKPAYNTPAWKQMVMCQEVGHTLGLDHQDEIFDNANLGTCMDYTSDPSTNQHPNQHDYDELNTIYSHLDSFTTIGQTTGQVARQLGQLAANQDLDNPGEWGRSIRDNGKIAVFERNLGLGNKVFTFVIWAK